MLLWPVFKDTGLWGGIRGKMKVRYPFVTDLFIYLSRFSDPLEGHFLCRSLTINLVKEQIKLCCGMLWGFFLAIQYKKIVVASKKPSWWLVANPYWLSTMIRKVFLYTVCILLPSKYEGFLWYWVSRLDGFTGKPYIHSAVGMATPRHFAFLNWVLGNNQVAAELRNPAALIAQATVGSVQQLVSSVLNRLSEKRQKVSS